MGALRPTLPATIAIISYHIISQQPRASCVQRFTSAPGSFVPRRGEDESPVFEFSTTLGPRSLKEVLVM